MNQDNNLIFLDDFLDNSLDNSLDNFKNPDKLDDLYKLNSSGKSNDLYKLDADPNKSNDPDKRDNPNQVDNLDKANNLDKDKEEARGKPQQKPQQKPKQTSNLKRLKDLIDCGLYEPNFDEVAEAFIEEELKKS